jgi:5-methylcytosine-specific restriction endonuclease McrA
VLVSGRSPLSSALRTQPDHRVDPVVSQIERAAVALAANRQPDALAALLEIDYRRLVELRTVAHARVWGAGGAAAGYKPPLPGAGRQAARRADIRATFTRDRYTCRYAHCRRPTVDLEVLKFLSKAFPDVLPYHPNWRPLDRHILYWTYSTSLEHRVPFPAGGTSAADNLITACYQCNDVKNYLPLEVLGWTVSPPEASGWRGLTEYLPPLRAAVRRVELRDTGA